MLSRPWYRSWWVVVPVLAGVGAVGVAVWIRNRKVPLGAVPLCAETFDDAGGMLEDVEYLEFRPVGIGPQTALPMIIVLADGDPQQIVDAVLGLPFATRVIVPRGIVQGPAGETWSSAPRGSGSAHLSEVQDAAAHLATFVEQVPRCRPTRGLPVVVGYDRGADVALALAAEVPHALAGVVATAGMLVPEIGQVGVPTTAIHGREDEVVPYEAAAAAVAAAVGQGAPITWVPMTGVGHSFAGALQIRTLQALADVSGAQLAR